MIRATTWALPCLLLPLYGFTAAEVQPQLEGEWCAAMPDMVAVFDAKGSQLDWHGGGSNRKGPFTLTDGAGNIFGMKFADVNFKVYGSFEEPNIHLHIYEEGQPPEQYMRFTRCSG